MLNKKGYRLLEHTADMGIEACADSCPQVLEEMARGLTMMLLGDSPLSASVITKVHLRDEDSVELMVAWLNEILYWCERNNLVPVTSRIDALENGELWATLSGEPFDRKRHHVERQIKAVTYHKATLEEDSGRWYAKVYVDL
jgi:SHS2 domain-containing protein